MKKLSIALLFSLMAGAPLADLPPESTPNVKTLPSDYPSSWVFSQDVNFSSLVAGKVILVDVSADSKEYKGAVDAAQMAAFVESKRLPELYVAETFYSRGTAGIRTDVVSIYDKSTLNKIDEIILPNNNRALIVVNKYLMRLIDNDKFLLIYNFTPATSVTVVDIKKRMIVDEIASPGCSMVYPVGKRGFASLCGDGSMFVVQLDRQGKQQKKTTVPSFFSVDDDPVFDKPVYINKTAYFISYKGMVHPVDMSGRQPRVLPAWSLLNKQQAMQNWRPSGWQIATSDGQQKLYVIMSENGYNGSHKNGGEEIWVANVDNQSLSNRISVNTNAFSIELTSGDNPLLVVTNVNMLLDVYNVAGKLQRSFNLGDAAMPLLIHAKR